MKHPLPFLLLNLLSLSYLQATHCNEQEIPIIVTVITADFGSDTFWELTNDNSGEQYGTSGFFLQDNKTYIDTVCVPNNSHLTFRVTCCINNMGSYKVEMLGVTIAEQGNFQFNNEIHFIAAALPELDAELSSVDLPNHLLQGPQVIAGKITNLGSTVIEAFDLNWEVDDQIFTQHIEGLQLQPFETYLFEHEQKWQASKGLNQVTVFLTHINGREDDNLLNNNLLRNVNVVATLSERTVLYESFSNASCSICAVADPIFVSTVLNNPGIAAISYHVNYPGFDPMYEENPTDVDTRLQYHEVFGVPYSVIEGGLLEDATQFILSAHVNAFRANDALINLAIIERMVEGIEGELDKIVLDVYVTPTVDIASTNLRLQTVIVEREVLYEFAPGSNGLTDFYYVMRKMLPNENGTPLSNLQINETQHFSFEYEVADYIKNRETLRSVVFVEDTDSKTILQTLRSANMLGENKAANLQKLGANFGYLTAALQHNRCATDAQGRIDIQLFGETENVTLLWSNGETGTTVSNLETGVYELQIIAANGSINEYEFEIFAPEGFEIEVNTTPEVDAQTNGSAGIELMGGQVPFVFEWNTGETTPYIEGKTAGVYTVNVTDAFGCQQTVEIVVDAVTAIEDLQKFDFRMFPNPAIEQLQTVYDLSADGLLQWYDLQGKEVGRWLLKKENQYLRLDIAHFPKGMYLYRLSSEGELMENGKWIFE
ncbi:MAG: T9SS type A sorting domain-containing protein [Chitinophagales bacterium]